MKNPSSAKRIVLSIVVVAGLAALVRAGLSVDFKSIRDAFAQLSVPLLAGSFVVSVIQVSTQIGRFHVLFSKSERPALSLSAWAASFGGFLNSFTPLRAGDLYKIAVNRHKAGVSAATSVTLAERITDVGSLFVLAAIGGFAVFIGWVQKGVDALQGSAAVIAVGVAVALAVVVALSLKFAKTKLRQSLQGFGAHFWRLIRSKRFLASFAISLAGWVIEAFSLQLTCMAAGSTLGIGQIFAAIFVLNMGIAVPVTVANVGVFEASLAFALGGYGIAPATGIAIAVAHHVVLFIALASWLLGLVLLRLSTGGLRPAATPVTVSGKAR